MTVAICIFALLLFYLAVSPRFGERLYRKKMFRDPTAKRSQPRVAEDFAWRCKTHLAVAARDGTPMNAWWYQQRKTKSKNKNKNKSKNESKNANKKKPTLVIYYIGRDSCISNVLPEVQRKLDCGYDVLVAEYRGFGQTRGDPSLKTVCEDALSIFDYAVTQLSYGVSQILVHGESLGGGIAAYVASQRHPAALSLHNTFRSLIAVGREHVPATWLFPAILHTQQSFDTEKMLRNWTNPVLISHAELDETIGFHHGAALYRAAIAPSKRFVTLPLSTHRIVDSSAAAGYNEALIALRRQIERA